MPGHANPDGYTLAAATTAASPIARLLVKSPTCHPVNDCESVPQFAETLNVLVVANSPPAKTVPEFIAYAKSGKKPFNMASAGVGLRKSSLIPTLLPEGEGLYPPLSGIKGTLEAEQRDWGEGNRMLTDNGFPSS